MTHLPITALQPRPRSAPRAAPIPCAPHPGRGIGRESARESRPILPAWRLARWVWGQQRARALLDGRHSPTFGRPRGVSTDGCAAIERIGRLGCRVDTSVGWDILEAAASGIANRLDDDAALVHCRVLGTGGPALALVVRCAEVEQTPDWDLPVTTWKPILARNGKARVYDPRVETHDTLRQPVDPANPADPVDAPAAGRYCKVYPDPSDADRLAARNTWRRFVAGLAALVDLLADQPLKRWRVDPDALGVSDQPWG